MGAAKNLIDKKLLRDFVPINSLSAVHIEEISRKAVIEEVRAGRYAFKSGDRDYQSVYLLEGSIELIDKGRDVVSTVHAGTEASRHPLAHKQPRQLSARASGKVTVARIDSSLLDVLLTWDETAGYDVVEIDAQDDDDWMTRMLQSQAFLQLPPSNIHRLLMRLESVNARAGETIVRQDEDADYFYIVKSGRLAVTRKASARSREVLLAELGEGACFGEDALVSESKRNASVMMVTDGSLMRLSKDDFNELLRESVVKELDFVEAKKLIEDGAQWLDVRLPGEFENQSIRGSTNLPLSALRDQCTDLDSDTTYIMCCDTGRRSSAGAFVLSQTGLDVYTLKNGMIDVPGEALTGKHPSLSGASTATDAEIIPFDAEASTTGETVRNKPADSVKGSADKVLTDKLAAAESEKIALEQQLGDVRKQLEASKAMPDEAQNAEQENNRLQAELAQMAKRLDQQQQQHESQLQEREQEIGRVREDYKQLGQRTSAVAGERDATVKELEDLRGRLAALKGQQNSRQAEAGEQLDGLQQTLEDEKSQRASLQQQYSELEARHRELEQQNASDTARAESGQTKNAELEAQLAAGEQKLQEYKQSLQQADEREQALQGQFEQLQKQAVDTQEQVQSGFSTERDELKEQLATVQAQLTAGEQKQQEYEQSLQQAGEREQALQEQHEQLQKQAVDTQKRTEELDSRLQLVSSEHESDITSVREAMARAQDECSNVQREHRRLLETLRKAERDLERTRHDHETEVLRLQKELKTAAGDSSAALAAELEALQQQIKEGERERDNIEIQLGERSAQLEDEQAETEKLGQLLLQAQQSAREAEQQLIETNQTANEEMGVRLEAEQNTQQTLRDELAAVSAERNESQEQLTVQNQELEELRQAIRMTSTETDSNAEKLQTLQDSTQQLEQTLAASQEAERQAHKEMDQLRAEAEVTRSLVDMQAAAESGAESGEELEQARQNVEIAVRLRTQAEQQASGLQQELEQLREELSRARCSDSPGTQAGHIPSLDANDPGASTLLTHDFETRGKDTDQAGVLLEDEENHVSSAPADRVTPVETGRPGGWKGLLVGLLIGGVLASGAWWFAPSRQGEETGKAGKEKVVSQPEAVLPVVDAVASKSRVPKKIPPIAKGTSTAPGKQTGKQAIAAAPKVSAPAPPVAPVKARIKKPVVAVKSPVQVIEQPVQSFQDTLSDGSAAPVMVKFRADSFTMGSGSTSPRFDERPKHRVNLSGFSISKYEVTFEQYNRFAQDTGRTRPADEGWGRGTRPVINVSWQDAIAYTRWLSEQTGARYRLPTEAEWEFSARSRSNKRFWWGKEVGENHANCFDCGGQWSGSQTARVGSYAASPFAVHDMAGNVMEWVQDCYQPGYADAPLDGSAVVTGECSARVVRGGSYSSPADLLRSASRDKRSPDLRLDNLGFRLVRD